MIDVAIAFALVFMMLAVLVSGVQELISSLLSLRGRMLVAGVVNLCRGVSGADAQDDAARAFALRVLRHPLLQPLWKSGERQPSYMPSGPFVLALADTLGRDYQSMLPLVEGLPEAVEKMPAGELRDALQTLVEAAKGDAGRLQQLVEAHFNRVMDRVSGWYKRQAQWTMLAIGFVIAVLLNVDALRIGQTLIQNGQIAARLADQAAVVVEQRKAVDAASGQDAGAQSGALQQQIETLQSLQLPIGWEVSADGGLALPADFSFMLALAGWMISALAASLGAPFWFDAMSKLVSVRASGSRPDDGGARKPDADVASAAAAAAAALAAPAAVETGPLNDFEANRLTPLDIESAQRSLRLPEARISGALDAATREAIRQWQRRHGQPASGQLDEPALLALLYPTRG
jgi:hypothetical protein